MKNFLGWLMALALAACAPASVTPAPAQAPSPTQTPLPTPGGAVVSILPTWTPAPADVAPTFEPPKCPDLKTQPTEMTFAPISDTADVIAYTGQNGVFAFDVLSKKSGLVVSKTDEFSLGQLAWSPDGKWLALVRAPTAGNCAGSQLIFANSRTGVARVFLADDAPIKILAWMPDSSALTIQDSLGVVNFSLKGENPFAVLPIQERVGKLEWVNANSAWYMGENPTGAQIVSLTLAQLNPLSVRPFMQGPLHHFSLSPNKKLLAVEWYDTINQTDVLDILDPSAQPTTIKTIKNLIGYSSIEWSPDGKKILVGFGLAGVLLIEGTPNGAEKQLDFYAKPAKSAWNADGSQFAVVTEGDISKEPPWLAIYTLKTNKLDKQPAYVWSPWEIAWRK